MSHPLLVYLHGFASAPQSSKPRFLAQRCVAAGVEFLAFDFTPTPRAFETLTVSGMIAALRADLVRRGAESVAFIGSSLGGLVGLHYAQRFGGVTRILGLAPALAFHPRWLDEPQRQAWEASGIRRTYHYYFEQELALEYAYYRDAQSYSAEIAPPVPLRILHGRQDDVVRIEDSRAYAAAYPDQVELIEVDSDHRLVDQLPFIWQHALEFLLA